MSPSADVWLFFGGFFVSSAAVEECFPLYSFIFLPFIKSVPTVIGLNKGCEHIVYDEDIAVASRILRTWDMINVSCIYMRYFCFALFLYLVMSP